MLLGERLGEKWFVEHSVQKIGQHLSAGRPASAGVESLVGVALAPVIHQGIARPAVKTRDWPCRGQQGQVADAADVEDTHLETRPGPQCGVKARHQRSALAAGSQIGRAEVGHHIQTGQLGKQGRVVELPGVPRPRKALRPVAHGLPVGANRCNVMPPNALLAGLGEQVLYGQGVKASQCIGRQGRPVQFIVSGAVECQEFLLELFGHVPAGLCQHP